MCSSPEATTACPGRPLKRRVPFATRHHLVRNDRARRGSPSQHRSGGENGLDHAHMSADFAGQNTVEDVGSVSFESAESGVVRCRFGAARENAN
jgi:hypothetical protein